MIRALDGYHCDQREAQKALDSLLGTISDPSLPQLEVLETLYVMGTCVYVYVVQRERSNVYVYVSVGYGGMLLLLFESGILGATAERHTQTFKC